MGRLNWNHLFSVFVLFLSLSAFPRWLKAQTQTTGTVVGNVTDQSGAAVPEAKVELTNPATNFILTVKTNAAGGYTLPNIPPGEYKLTVTAMGFSTAVRSRVVVEVAKSALADVILQIGQISEKVEVTASGAELQTSDSSVGDVVGGESMEQLPTIQRRVAELVYLQVGAQPIAGTGGYDKGGGIAGARPDQNSYTLDGIEITDPEEGGIYGQIGPGIPLPLEAVEEFRGTVTNPNASFGRVSGGDFTFTTRHGTNNFHGTGYWYHQDNALDANTWTRNSLSEAKPKLIDNRFGSRIGGPIWKEKTFFFGFYEGRRFPQSTDIVRLVPTDTFRQGTLRFRDSTGNIVSYNLATSTLCGTNGSGTTANLPCDPRGIGISPLISQLMSHYPGGNSPGDGDGLNTIGFRGPADSSQRNDFALFRLDHNFTQKWRFNGSYLYSRERNLTPLQQVEMDPALTKGKSFLTLAGLPNEGRVVNGSLNGQITPQLLNEFRVGWTQTGIPLDRQLARIQVDGAGAPLDLAETGGLLPLPRLLDSPGDPNGSFARPQFGREHLWHFNDNLNWLKGKHSLQTGFSFVHGHFHHWRVDKVIFTTVPVAVVSAGTFLQVPPSQRPPSCSAAQATNCLASAGDQAAWDILYASMLGMVDNTTYFTTRDAQGNPNPPGTPDIADVNWKHLELYAADTFKISPSLTLSYGLNFMHETPVDDTGGRQGFLVDLASGRPIVPKDFLAQREAAAQQGKTFNPQVAFATKNSLGNRGIYPDQNKFGPRVALSWNPSFRNGLLGSLLGERKTVIRGGYSLVYERINVVGPVEVPLIGLEELGDTSSVQAPLNGVGQPFRVGVDGPAPIPAPNPKIPLPFIPSARNATLGTDFGITFGLGFDPNYSVGHIHSGNLTFQRELKGDMVAELGWIGRYGRNLPVGLNLNAVPVDLKDMSGKSSQTFAQAFDAVATQLRTGAAVAPQSWFENSLGAGATATLAAADVSDFVAGGVGSLFQNFIDPAFMSLGASPVLNQQFQNMFIASNGGWSNYNALFVSLRKRTFRGLSFTANYTYAHSLDTAGSVQDNVGGALTNPYNISFDYADALTDRRHSFTGYGMWELPFFRHNRFLGGWYLSGIFSAYTGLPLVVNQGGDVFGNSFGIESVPSANGVKPSIGLHQGVAGSDGIGTAGDPAAGGTGLNLFADPAAVFKSLRPFLISQDHRSARGLIRDLGWWNLDSSIGKKFAIKERLSVTLSFDFFNMFNHVIFSDPGSMSLLDPANFGVITQQAGNPAYADFAGPRRIQAGLRLEF